MPPPLSSLSFSARYGEHLVLVSMGTFCPCTFLVSYYLVDLNGYFLALFSFLLSKAIVFTLKWYSIVVTVSGFFSGKTYMTFEEFLLNPASLLPDSKHLAELLCSRQVTGVTLSHSHH